MSIKPVSFSWDIRTELTVSSSIATFMGCIVMIVGGFLENNKLVDLGFIITVIGAFLYTGYLVQEYYCKKLEAESGQKSNVETN